MQFVQPDVQTVCLGLVASMGSFLLGQEAQLPNVLHFLTLGANDSFL